MLCVVHNRADASKEANFGCGYRGLQRVYDKNEKMERGSFDFELIDFKPLVLIRIPVNENMNFMADRMAIDD